MRRKRPTAKKAPKVAYRYIAPESADGERMYRLLAELVAAHHEDLYGARIALAWQRSWTPDVDGRVILGQCRKVGDLDREVFEVAHFDFIILLREAFWRDVLVTDHQRRALLDHELTHATVKLDANGEPVVDERNRTVYRMRKHDVEDFSGIVARYGLYKADLEAFAAAVEHARVTVDAQWVGYRSLREELQQAGVTLPLETIASWNADERREARTWAVLRLQFPGASVGAPPAHVVPSPSPAASVAGEEGPSEAPSLGLQSAPAAETAASDPSASDASER
jgi:hypothetical protein